MLPQVPHFTRHIGSLVGLVVIVISLLLFAGTAFCVLTIAVTTPESRQSKLAAVASPFFGTATGMSERWTGLLRATAR